MFDVEQYVEITLMPDIARINGTIRHTDGQHLLIAVSPSDSKLIQIGMSVQLVQATKTGIYQVDTTVLNCREGLFVAKKERPQLLQRRRNQRLTCDMEGVFWPNCIVEEIPEMSRDEGVVVRVRDISIGGAQLLAKKVVCKGLEIGLMIQLTQADRILSEARVVRCGLLETPDPEHPNLRYIVATQFTRVTRIDQVQLQRFLIQLAHSANS